jgi:hypothetical protein
VAAKLDPAGACPRRDAVKREDIIERAIELEAQAEALLALAGDLREHAYGLATGTSAQRGRVTLETARDLARELGEFTTHEFATALTRRCGVGRASGLVWRRKLLENDPPMIEATNLRRASETARSFTPGTVYRYRRPESSAGPARERRATPEEEVAAEFKEHRVNGHTTRSATKHGSIGAIARRIKDDTIRELVTVADETEGWRVLLPKRNGGYIKLIPPEGPMLSLPFTPSDHRTPLNCRAQARRAGLDV